MQTIADGAEAGAIVKVKLSLLPNEYVMPNDNDGGSATEALIDVLR